MIKVLFICWGNICRSPMGEFILKKMVADSGIADQFEIASCATSTEEIGNPVYPPARRELAKHGISCDGKYARQLTYDDYEYYDYILIAEEMNRRYVSRIVGEDVDGKVHRVLEFSDRPRDISDPWYHGDFETTYAELVEGCETFIKYLQQNNFICSTKPKKPESTNS